MTYILLNLVFIVVILAVLVATKQLQKLRPKPVLFTLLVLVLLTAVFDNFIIGFGLVTYDTAKILGVYIGKAPIEDFAYTLVVVGLVPVLWNVMGKRHED